jgi:hypothetical protein
MSTERSAVLVIGWQKNDSESLTEKLYPIARKFEIEHDTDDLPNILSEDYSHLFTKSMSKELKALCQEQEIEIVAGADGGEDGSWYFGFGIPYVQGKPVTDFLTLVHDLSTVLKNSVEGIEISEPKVYNVISWF